MSLHVGVMEGYSTGTSGPTGFGSPTAHAQQSFGTHTFQSAKDTLREIYPINASTNVSHTSLNKRGRAKSEELETATSDIPTEHPDMDMPYLGPSFSGPELRPIKPLKRSGRQFTETRSLPAGSLRFSGDSQSMFPSAGLEAKIVEEEDWSEAPSFASASTTPHRDI